MDVDALLSTELSIVGSASEADRALELLDQLRPSLFVVDAAGDGLACLQTARERLPGVRAIAVGAADAPGEIEAALAAGAAAYVQNGFARHRVADAQGPSGS